jgi:hypothetical protein
MEQASIRQVAGLRIVTQNAGDLRKRLIVSRSVLHYVVREKANRAAINPTPVTQIAVIAISSFPSTINCNLRRRTTTSSFNTSLQNLCSSH